MGTVLVLIVVNMTTVHVIAFVVVVAEQHGHRFLDIEFAIVH